MFWRPFSTTLVLARLVLMCIDLRFTQLSANLRKSRAHLGLSHLKPAEQKRTVHTDVKRPKMWPKLNKGKTTEAMSVVLIALDYVSPAHLAVKKNLN